MIRILDGIPIDGCVLLVCGGRAYSNLTHMTKVLDSFHEQSPIGLLVQGGAQGADFYAASWARRRLVNCLTIPAQWNKLGRAAGPRRNLDMLDWKPDYVIAFPGGIGTADMVRKALAAGIAVENAQEPVKP
jgi:hypothetical protein